MPLRHHHRLNHRRCFEHFQFLISSKAWINVVITVYKPKGTISKRQKLRVVEAIYFLGEFLDHLGSTTYAEANNYFIKMYVLTRWITDGASDTFTCWFPTMHGKVLESYPCSRGLLWRKLWKLRIMINNFNFWGKFLDFWVVEHVCRNKYVFHNEIYCLLQIVCFTKFTIVTMQQFFFVHKQTF